MSIDLLGTLLSTVLQSRPRRRSRRAIGFLTGRHHAGRGLAGALLNPKTIMTAAGVVWGIYETIQQRQGAGGAVPGASPAPAPVPTPAGGPVPPVPPVSTGAGSATGVAAGGGADLDPATLRMLRLAYAAANADGLMTDEERSALDGQAAAAGVPPAVLQQLGARVSLGDILAGVDDPAERTALYVVAFTVARADEQVSGAERIFLARVASLLSLDPPTVAAIEQETAARIDAAGDEPDQR